MPIFHRRELYLREHRKNFGARTTTLPLTSPAKIYKPCASFFVGACTHPPERSRRAVLVPVVVVMCGYVAAMWSPRLWSAKSAWSENLMIFILSVRHFWKMAAFRGKKNGANSLNFNFKWNFYRPQLYIVSINSTSLLTCSTLVEFLWETFDLCSLTWGIFWGLLEVASKTLLFGIGDQERSWDWERWFWYLWFGILSARDFVEVHLPFVFASWHWTHKGNWVDILLMESKEACSSTRLLNGVHVCLCYWQNDSIFFFFFFSLLDSAEDCDPHKLFGEGKRHLACHEPQAAVECLQEACRRLWV